MRYDIKIDVITDEVQDIAGFNAILTYLITQQAKTLPGVSSVQVTEITVDPEE